MRSSSFACAVLVGCAAVAVLRGCAALVPAGWLLYLCCCAGAAVGLPVQPCDRWQSGAGSGSQIRLLLVLFCGPVLLLLAALVLLNWLCFR